MYYNNIFNPIVKTTRNDEKWLQNYKNKQINLKHNITTTKIMCNNLKSVFVLLI